ncbi:MAG TPA: AbrB/MazE/SpoVT family DNA-binding domain-containing protein [Chloroflexota bacterium]|nr:AbrB/MazE/SpoVT family DNA-binding domain-containing protein [Chloroflexota bacterium]
MRELLTVVTREGQVTIPAEIRRALGMKRGDRVAFVMEKDEVRLVPRGSVVGRTAGILKSKESRLTAEELREAAEEAIAEGVVERMGE